jgi:hypothetical protein
VKAAASDAWAVDYEFTGIF